MKFHVFRNHTVEHLFKHLDATYSYYSDISIPTPSPNNIIWFYQPTPNPNVAELIEEIKSSFEKLNMVINQLPTNRFFIFLQTARLIQNWSHNDRGVIDTIQDFNYKVISLSQQYSNIQFIDFDDFSGKFSLTELVDWKFYYMSDMLINPKLANSFKIWFDVKQEVLNKKRKKCLILDLDNTLWGGVLGEDGIDAIKIGDTYPGRAFSHFQKNILEASRNGVILAICSKNNEKDVEDVWNKNPYMLLRKEHFATYRINWQNKAQNIAEIADELNIGLDSFVFIDDNPAERTIVKQHLPEVEVPDFPQYPYQLGHFFNEVYQTYFQTYRIVNEDKAKTEQYLENTKRKLYQRRFVNMDDYLQSLEMTLTIRFADKFNMARIAQMTQKTNQFNLTTRRYLESDIERFLNEGHLVVSLSIKDKFGDNGITVAAIVTINKQRAHIDTFLLSCRILGRDIEKAFAHYLINLLGERNVKEVTAEYLPTAKNNQAQNFYEKIGFDLVEEKKDGRKFYKIIIGKPFQIKPYYRFLTQE